MRIYSLIKAAFSQDMNLFKISVNNNSSRLKKAILPLTLFCLILYVMGTYAYGIVQILLPMNLIHVMLTLFISVCIVISFVEAVYKSQGILFDAKDNNLLLSLPIKKSYVLFVRILKLLTFQYLFNLMFLLPAIVVYAYYMKPNISFYIISFVMSILVPIIPTILGSVIGYLIKWVSCKFNKKNVVQSILTVITTVGIILICMNINNLMNQLMTKAQEINNAIIQLYYPIRLYMNLIHKFNLYEFMLLIIINIIPLMLFVLIWAKYYYKIISKMSESATTHIKKSKKDNIASKKTIIALTLKELKRYFSSPIYIINTLFGPVMLLITTIGLSIKGISVLNTEGITLPIDLNLYLPAIYYILITTVCSITQITASSISLEGKTINIVKSLPIKEKNIFKSKILMSIIIQLPLITIASVLFILKFRLGLGYSLLILGAAIMCTFFMSCLGLIINLKYPKMNANNDTEIVKQSMSVMLATLLGLIFVGMSVGTIIYLSIYMSIKLALFFHLLLVAILGALSYIILVKKGASYYKKIMA